MTTLTLAVIIPHYNDLMRLDACLAGLAPQLAAHPEVEAIVGDNNSPVDLAPLQAKFPAVRFVTETRKGAAAARNCAVRASTAPNLIFLDSDCIPEADWLATALGLAGQDRAVGGRVETFDETPAPRSGAEAFETVFAFPQKFYVEQKGFSVTANLLTSRKVFDDVGDFIVGVSEDVDWCHRATAKGYALVYAEALAVRHPTRQDWAALWKKWKRTTEEGFGLNGKGLKARLRWLLRAAVVAASPLAHTPKVLGSAKLTSGHDRRAALGTLYRLRLARAGLMLSQVLRGH